MELSRHFYFISGVCCVLFLKTTVIKKLFMHEGCVPYRTMHPDAECLGKIRTVMKIKLSLEMKWQRFGFFYAFTIYGTINSTLQRGFAAHPGLFPGCVTSR